MTWGFSWPDAWDKSQHAQATIRALLKDRRVPHDELYVEYPGLNSAHGPLAPLPAADALNQLNEVWTRLVLRTPEKAAAEGRQTGTAAESAGTDSQPPAAAAQPPVSTEQKLADRYGKRR